MNAKCSFGFGRTKFPLRVFSVENICVTKKWFVRILATGKNFTKRQKRSKQPISWNRGDKNDRGKTCDRQYGYSKFAWEVALHPSMNYGTYLRSGDESCEVVWVVSEKLVSKNEIIYLIFLLHINIIKNHTELINWLDLIWLLTSLIKKLTLLYCSTIKQLLSFHQLSSERVHHISPMTQIPRSCDTHHPWEIPRPHHYYPN